MPEFPSRLLRSQQRRLLVSGLAGSGAKNANGYSWRGCGQAFVFLWKKTGRATAKNDLGRDAVLSCFAAPTAFEEDDVFKLDCFCLTGVGAAPTCIRHPSCCLEAHRMFGRHSCDN